jgi:hypothetical protein
VRQQVKERLEDFAHKVYVLALDGYEKCEEDKFFISCSKHACLCI